MLFKNEVESSKDRPFSFGELSLMALKVSRPLCAQIKKLVRESAAFIKSCGVGENLNFKRSDGGNYVTREPGASGRR